VQVEIPQDRKEPGLGPFEVAKLAQLRVGLAKGLLGKVFRVGRTTTEPVGIAVERLVMLIDEGLYSPTITGRIHGAGYLTRNDAGDTDLFPRDWEKLGGLTIYIVSARARASLRSDSVGREIFFHFSGIFRLPLYL
jgi:hypothetical protein